MGIREDLKEARAYVAAKKEFERQYAAGVFPCPWVSVDDGLPDNDDDVLIAYLNDDGHLTTSIGFYDGGEWDGTYFCLLDGTVTHWMHIPKVSK